MPDDAPGTVRVDASSLARWAAAQRGEEPRAASAAAKNGRPKKRSPSKKAASKKYDGAKEAYRRLKKSNKGKGR